jgi:hypothetical protein
MICRIVYVMLGSSKHKVNHMLCIRIAIIKMINIELSFYVLLMGLYLLMPSILHAEKPSDLQIPDYLKVLTTNEVKIQASSTQNGFDTANLFKNIGWRAWGSVTEDRRNAWLSFTFNRSYYLSILHWIPGDHRELSFFKRCGRPAQVELVSHTGERRIIKLPNHKKLQVITLDQPLIARSLKITFQKSYGASVHAGVCMSALHLYVHSNPLKSITGLQDQINQALYLLDDPFTFERGAYLMRKVSHVVAPTLVERIRKTKIQKEQEKLLILLGQIADLSVQDMLRAIKPKIHILNLNTYRRTLAALGDQASIQNLLKDLDSLPIRIRALRLEAIARTAELQYLPLLMKHFGYHIEIDTVLIPLLRHFHGVYNESLELYHSNNGQRKAAFLALLGAIDSGRIQSLIRKALNQKDNPMLKSGGIRAAKYSHVKNLRARIRNMIESPYVVIRKAIATTMAHWGSQEDYEGLRVLAMDKSMSVRLKAIRGLQDFEQGHDLLETYALKGGDEASAETAAWTWLQGQTKKSVTVPISLLQSEYETVRKIGRSAINKYQKDACLPLSKLILKQTTHFEESERALRKLWSKCSSIFLTYVSTVEAFGKIRALELLTFWQAREGLPLVQKQLYSSNFQVRNIAVKSLLALAEPAEGIKTLTPLLKDSSEIVRCQILKALAHLQDQGIIKLIKKTLNKYQRNPDYAKKTVLCHLKSIELLKASSLAPIVYRSYKAWGRSIAFATYRKAAIEAIRYLRHPQRVSTLMEAMSDLDPRIRKLAEEYLRDAY